jgi:hypothetical protein
MRTGAELLLSYPTVGFTSHAVNPHNHRDYRRPSAPAKKSAKLLYFVSTQLSAMNRKTIIETREAIRNSMDNSPQCSAVLEVIDGHLALREIQGAPAWETE